MKFTILILVVFVSTCLVCGTDDYRQVTALLTNIKQVTLADADFGNPLFRPPLRTRGRDIVDAHGERFKLASVNWYGASDELFVPGGLDIQHRSEIARLIRHLGFNSVRLPYSDEMVVSNPYIPSSLLAANEDLTGSRALGVFRAVVESLTDAGLAVVINNHITHARWCCGINPCDASWHNDYLGPLCTIRQTEDQWIEHWGTVMSLFVNNSRVVGADLRNEPRGLWGSMKWDEWATAAERAGNRLLEMQKNWLIIIEGIHSSNDLSGVRERPIVLNVPDHVIYEAHMYSWSGWGNFGGPFSRRSYESFAKAMEENWEYIREQDLAPVWLGEMGAPHDPSRGDMHYWANLMRYLKTTDADFGYWAINPRKPHDNETETYSLVEDDWQTPILDYRMLDLAQIMRE